MQIRLDDTGIYKAHYSVIQSGRKTHKVTSLRTSIRSEAEVRAHELSSGIKPEVKAMTVAQALSAYIDQHLAPRRQDQNVSGFAQHAIATHFKGIKVAEVTNDMAEDFAAARIAGRIGKLSPVAPQTVRKELVTLQAALNFVVKKGLVRGCGSFQLPKPPDSEPRDLWMTEQQEAVMLAALPDQSIDMQVFVRLALSYGARRQAIIDLTWEQIDFDRGVIDFNRPGARKTRKRRAKVPMTKAVREVLDLKSKDITGRNVIDRNTPLHFKKFADGLGLGWVTPHVLKHTAVTLMLRAGVPVSNVSALTATDIRTIQKTYRHHCSEELCAAAERRTAMQAAHERGV